MKWIMLSLWSQWWNFLRPFQNYSAIHRSQPNASTFGKKKRRWKKKKKIKCRMMASIPCIVCCCGWRKEIDYLLYSVEVIDWLIGSMLNTRLDHKLISGSCIRDMIHSKFTDYSIDLNGGEWTLCSIFNLNGNRRTAIMNWYIRYKIESGSNI